MLCVVSGKTKAANRELSAILDDIEVALKSETANILCVGTLLLEAKAPLGIT